MKTSPDLERRLPKFDTFQSLVATATENGMYDDVDPVLPALLADAQCASVDDAGQIDFPADYDPYRGPLVLMGMSDDQATAKTDRLYAHTAEFVADNLPDSRTLLPGTLCEDVQVNASRMQVHMAVTGVEHDGNEAKVVATAIPLLLVVHVGSVVGRFIQLGAIHEADHWDYLLDPGKAPVSPHMDMLTAGVYHRACIEESGYGTEFLAGTSIGLYTNLPPVESFLAGVDPLEEPEYVGYRAVTKLESMVAGADLRFAYAAVALRHRFADPNTGMMTKALMQAYVGAGILQ